MSKGLKAVLVTVTTAILVACSVKEDRDDCPCLLSIDTEQAVEGNLLLNLAHLTQGVICQEEVSNTSSSFSIEVPKGMVCVSAFSGSDGWEISEDGLEISLPEGLEPGYIYAHSDLVDCSGETADDHVEMHKQWCTVSIVLDTSDDWDSCSFTMEGSWNGISLRDFSALEGDFSCLVTRSFDTSIETRVTRQGDETLRLRISQEGQSDRLRSVGKAIAATGYDWSSPSLEDVTIKLSDCIVEVDLSASDWEEGKVNTDTVI